MINSETKTIEYPNGEIQRVQCVRFDSFNDLDFIHPTFTRQAYDKIVSLYRDFIVPKAPYIFGQLVLFHVEDSFFKSVDYDKARYGEVDSLSAKVSIVLRRGLKVVNGKPIFLTSDAETVYNKLKKHGFVEIVSGCLPQTNIIPVGSNFGFLSECDVDAQLKVNSSFFTMDRFDCQTVYDELGTPIGLYAKDGIIFNPPMFHREALIVRKDGSVSVEHPSLTDLTITINGTDYSASQSMIYMRPAFRRTPKSHSFDLVIIGRRIAAIKKHGNTYVPTSGFVISVDDINGISVGDCISYGGMEDVIFAVQVGNSIVINGKETLNFISEFYNIKNLWSISFPPSLYPLDYEKARAPRIALGADKNNRPMLAWIEGPGKFGYDFGKESCGASLLEMTEICSNLGMYNAINMDGGGSAQILINNSRSLLISDRNKSDNSEAERAVPIGLVIL